MLLPTRGHPPSPGSADGIPDTGRPEGNRSGVCLRVLPFTAGAHAAAGYGSMTLLHFADTPEIGVIHLATISGGVTLDSREELARYLRTFTHLRSAALSTTRSAHLIHAISRTHDH